MGGYGILCDREKEVYNRGKGDKDGWGYVKAYKQGMLTIVARLKVIRKTNTTNYIILIHRRAIQTKVSLPF